MTQEAKYSPVRLSLIKADYKAENLKKLVDEQDGRIACMENELAAMQARLEGLQGLNEIARRELQEALAECVTYGQEFEKEKEKEGVA